MASWNEPTERPHPLAFFIGLKNGCLLAAPFWAVVCIIVILLRDCK